ncbi:sodium/potassium-transporting ATPase subunit beta-1-interacting protein [Galendromus occidentalis]|uniref:Sodium/potassium-transporting ATPase subunit beta-1-interacting protein n=1 Tax=Galendromus occidentalis TaxID=34638 RepID=A0AAJ7SFY3_9ACAR|nr:sodium/potassium-transporting ATPase subunit beta-1-interacting protein [Galendromus occidentalis]
MGCCCCTSRGFMIGVCVLQLSFTACRQLFDLLGYMWAPILANFFNFLFVIFGLFGVYQYRPRYVSTYVLWTVIWIIWNAFCICFYLEIGILNRELNYLNLGTGSRSWFEINGLGCKAMFEPHTPDELAGFTKPASVDGCLVEYYYVESTQAAIQVILGLLALFVGTFVIYNYTQEDPSSVRRKGPWALDPLHRSTASLPYSIEYHHVSNHSQAGSFNQHSKFNSNSIGSANSSQRRRRRSLRSNRSSQRASYQNPVTRLIDRYVDTSSQDSYNHLAEYLKTSANNNLHTLGNGSNLVSGGPFNQAYGSNVGPGGQINQAYENRYSIASSGTYGVVDNVPSPPYTPYSAQAHPQPPPRNVETNM